MLRANKLPTLTDRETDAMSASAREASDFLKAMAHESGCKSFAS